MVPPVRVLAGLPVLYRQPGETQIGADERHAVVVSNAPPELDRLLQDLGGKHSATDLLDRAGPTLGALIGALRGLDKRGLTELVDDPPATPPARLIADGTAWALRTGTSRDELHRIRERSVVTVHGSGRLALALALLLAESGVGWVHSVNEGKVTAEDLGCGFPATDIGLDRSAAVTRAVRRAAPGVRVDQPPPDRAPDLVLLTGTAVPEPRLPAQLFAAGIPHLLVRAGEGYGTVGPLVIPGLAGCLHCINMHLTEADTCWPTVAAQLAVRPQQSDLVTTRATAAIAIGQVLGVLHGATPEQLACWGATIDVDAFSGATGRTPAPPHPRCRCAPSGRRQRTRPGQAAPPPDRLTSEAQS